MKNSILLRSILFVAVIFLIKISQPASSVFAGYYTWTNIGLKGEYIDSIAIDPKTPSIIYAGALSGVFKSINGGETWTTINNGLNIPWSNDNNHLAIDPTNTDIIYTAIDDGVFKSTNGGGNWTAVNNGLFLCQMLSLAIDPITPATIYVGTCGGVYKSINGGGNWVPINNGLSSTTIAKDLTIDPKTPSTLYVSSWPGVKKSINGGQNWDTVYSTSNIYSLAIDPLTTTTIYAFGNSGLIKSTNGGGNWSAANTGLTDKGPIVIDPKTPSTVYVGTYYFSGVFKSTNGGGNWNPVDNSGLRDDQGYSLSVNSIAIDPITPSTIYAGTRDGVFVMQQIEEPRYSISGKATISGTTDFSAVTISVGNGITTSTDTNGNYTLSNLKSGNYTITPSKAGYTFSPLSIPVTIASANIIGQNFTAVPTKVWTLIYYLAGDNDLSSSYGKIFNQLELGNNSATQVLVLLDQRTIIPGDSAYYLIQHDTNLSSFASYTEGTNKWSQGELDMNDPQTLINFGQWVYRNFPSQHYALFLDDHGSGLTGAMAEETLFTKIIMSVNQIKDALNTITNNGTHKFDIITMNACLMGMIEDACKGNMIMS